MSSKIDKLTHEQEAKLPIYADQWLKVGLSTDPIDFNTACEGINEMYDEVKQPRPTKFYRYRSPEEALLGIRLYEELDGEYIEDPRAFLETADPALKEAVLNSHEMSDHINNFCYGNHDAHWVAFYSFFHNETDVEGLEAVVSLQKIAKSCGWYSLYEDEVFIQERPVSIKLDDRDLPHCEDGPFLEYSDGFSLYAWHGTVIPAEWIENKSSITPEVILRHPDVEQRRCATEIVGWAEALKLMNCRSINVHPNPLIGELLEADIPEIGTERFLKVECGTGRTFALPVPPEMKTALESQGWLNQCSEEEILNLQVRT